MAVSVLNNSCLLLSPVLWTVSCKEPIRTLISLWAVSIAEFISTNLLFISMKRAIISAIRLVSAVSIVDKISFISSCVEEISECTWSRFVRRLFIPESMCRVILVSELPACFWISSKFSCTLSICTLMFSISAKVTFCSSL